MKIITKIKVTLALMMFCVFTACNTMPVIVPDISTTATLRADNIHDRNGWGWVLWYLPIMFGIGAWAWCKYVRNCSKQSSSDS